MYPFIECTVLVQKEKISLRRKCLIRLDTIVGVQELNAKSCKITIERRDGSVEAYVVETEFDEIKDLLNAIRTNTHPEPSSQEAG